MRTEPEEQGCKQTVGDSLKKHMEWFYSLFPCKSQDKQWEEVQAIVYKKLTDRHAKILCQQRQFVGLGVCRSEEDDNALQPKWLPVTGDQQGIFHSLTVDSEKNEKHLVNLLLSFMLLTSAPRFLNSQISKSVPRKCTLTLSPELVRESLRHLVGRHGNNTNLHDLPFVVNCDFEQLIVNISSLLDYCLSDMTSNEWNVDRYLKGLPLLVTADHNVRCFNGRSPVFLPDFFKLLPHLPSNFIHDELWSKSCLRHISTMSQTVVPLSVMNFSRLVADHHLPYTARQGREIMWNKQLPSAHFLSIMWKFFMEHVHEWDVLYRACKTFSVIPTTTGKLAPLHQVDVIARPQYGPIACTLSAMGCPFSDFRAIFEYAEMCRKIEKYLKDHLANINNATEAIKCLIAVYTAASLNTDIEPGRIDELLISLLQEELDDHDKETLKRLPLFATTNGCRVSLLSQGPKVYFWPKKMPVCGLDPNQLANKARITLLSPEGRVALLIKKELGVEDIDAAKLYNMHLFQLLPKMHPRDLWQHMEFIHDYIFSYRSLGASRDTKQKENLLKQLKGLPFVTVQQCSECSKGTFPDDCVHTHCPCDLYDPTHPVFQARLSAAHFPQQRWIAWKTFLQELGLQTRLTRQQFLLYINDVHCQRMAAGKTHLTGSHKSQDIDWRHVSVELLKNFFNEQLPSLLSTQSVKDNYHLSNSPETEQFLRKVSQTEFVFRQDQLECVKQIKKLLPDNEHSQLTAIMRTHNLIPLHGSILSCDAPLVWSTRPILPDFYLSRGHKDVWRLLGIYSPPQPVDIARHLANISQSISYHSTLLQSAGKVVKEKLYSQLKQIYESLSCVNSDDANDRVCCVLQNVPCVLVDHDKSDVSQFVLASQLCRSIEEEIRPAYLLQVPTNYQQYLSLLKRLGMIDKPTAAQYAAVLRMLHKQHGENPMKRGSLSEKAAIQAIGGLVRCLRTDNKGNPPKDGEEYPTAEHLKPLYLPTESLTLVPSDQLVYADSKYLYHIVQHTEMFKFIISLQLCGDCGEPNGQRLPPRGMGIQLLSRLVVKELDSSTNHSTNVGEVLPYSQMARNLDHLRAILVSSEFATAIRRLHFDRHKTQLDDHEEALLQHLQNCQFACVKKLSTVLVHAQRGEVIDGTQSRESCFIQKATTCLPNCTGKMLCEPAVIYIQVQDVINDNPSFLSMLATDIGVFLESSFNLLPLFQVLHAKSPEDIPSILDKCRISSFYDKRSDKRRHTENVSKVEYGTGLTNEEQLLLVDDPTLPLSTGRCVAYKEREDTAPVTALVLEKLEDVQLDSDPLLVTKWKLSVGDGTGSDDSDVVLASQLQIYEFQKKFTLQPEAVLGEEDEHVHGEAHHQPHFQREEHRQDIVLLVQQASKMPHEERQRMLCRLWKTYHPAKQLSAFYTEYTQLLDYLLQCVQEQIGGQAVDSFQQLIKDRLAPELRREGEIARKVMVGKASGRRVHRNGLFSRPEPTEVCCSEPRRQYGVIVRHSVSYLRTSICPGPWLGGDWSFVHSTTPSRQQFSTLQFSRADDLTCSVLHHLTNIQQYSAGQQADGSKVLSPYQAWQESHVAVERLFELFFQFCSKCGESADANTSGNLLHMFEKVKQYLPVRDHHEVLESIRMLHMHAKSAQEASTAFMSILNCTLKVMKQLSATEEQARAVELLNDLSGLESGVIGAPDTKP